MLISVHQLHDRTLDLVAWAFVDWRVEAPASERTVNHIRSASRKGAACSDCRDGSYAHPPLMVRR